MSEAKPTDLPTPDPRLSPLPISAGPAPLLEQAIGFQSPARFVGFHRGSDHRIFFSDGQLETTGNLKGYALFRDHPYVSAALNPRHLLTQEDEQHLLLLDTESRRLYVAEVTDGRRFLQEQWSRRDEEETSGALGDLEPLLRLIETKMQAHFEAWERDPKLVDAVLARCHEERYQARAALKRWLDRRAITLIAARLFRCASEDALARLELSTRYGVLPGDRIEDAGPARFARLVQWTGDHPRHVYQRPDELLLTTPQAR